MVRLRPGSTSCATLSHRLLHHSTLDCCTPTQGPPPSREPTCWRSGLQGQRNRSHVLLPQCLPHVLLFRSPCHTAIFEFGAIIFAESLRQGLASREEGNTQEREEWDVRRVRAHLEEEDEAVGLACQGLHHGLDGLRGVLRLPLLGLQRTQSNTFSSQKHLCYKAEAESLVSEFSFQHGNRQPVFTCMFLLQKLVDFTRSLVGAAILPRA
jgi:hypothetical protein